MVLPRPETLSQVDFVRLRFILEFSSPCSLQPAVFVALRQRLRLAGRQSLESDSNNGLSRWNGLFQPPLSDDPVALRKFQKPSPAFVLQWPFPHEQRVAMGDIVALEVLFLGTGIPLIHDFSRSLIHLGHLGMVEGKGFYEVAEIQSTAADLSAQTVWRKDEIMNAFSPNILTLDWWLDSNSPVRDKLTLEFVTPTRLMVRGKPLRKPHFRQLFPFMLRRVSSMLYAHCGVEIVDDPASLLAEVDNLNVVESILRWSDWRPSGGVQSQPLGGFVGRMTLEGLSLAEIDWILAAATLFGVGKGAAYGAGQIRLHEASVDDFIMSSGWSC